MLCIRRDAMPFFIFVFAFINPPSFPRPCAQLPQPVYPDSCSFKIQFFLWLPIKMVYLCVAIKIALGKRRCTFVRKEAEQHRRAHDKKSRARAHIYLWKTYPKTSQTTRSCILVMWYLFYGWFGLVRGFFLGFVRARHHAVYMHTLHYLAISWAHI